MRRLVNDYRWRRFDDEGAAFGHSGEVFPMNLLFLDLPVSLLPAQVKTSARQGGIASLGLFTYGVAASAGIRCHEYGAQDFGASQ